MADLLEKRAPFNGMRGKRGEELVGQHQPDQVTTPTSWTDFQVR